MFKKINLGKGLNSKSRIQSGNKIIQKLENLYQSKKILYPNHIEDPNSILYKKKISYLNKEKDKFKKLSSSNNFNKNSDIVNSRESLIKKNVLKHSQSADPPTLDATVKITKSKIINSSSKNNIQSDIKGDPEIKNANKKVSYKIINNKNKVNSEDEDINKNNISLHSNKNVFENENENDYKNFLIKEQSIKLVNDINENENDKNNYLNMSDSEVSLSSYKSRLKFPYLIKDYYSSMFDTKKYRKREKILQRSLQFHIHRHNFSSKTLNFRKRGYDDNLIRNKHKVFSQIKRVPSVVAFGKVASNESSIIHQKYNKNKLFKPNQTLGHNNSSKNVFRKGLTNNYSIKKLTESKLIKDDYNTNNPNTELYIPKDQFGNAIYPIFNRKKTVKNILPKEYDYNTIRPPLELLHDTYHPLLRYQKKMFNQHINAINQEIGVAYTKPFTLVDKNKIPEKYQMCQDLIDLQKDEKLIKLIRELIDRNFGLDKEVAKALDLQKKEKENLRKKQLYRRFCEVMLKASIHFKRLNISLESFYSMSNSNYDFNIIEDEKNMVQEEEEEVEKKTEKIKNKEKGKDNTDNKEEEIVRNKQVLNGKNCQHFLEAIRFGDVNEIIRIMNYNYFIMFYKDHFLQTPLHIAAKRNLYNCISLFISRGADINSQDEGGRTPLFIAAEKNHLEFVTVLLFEIADPSIKNIKGERAIEVTTNSRIKIILERAKILHYFHKIGKIQHFNEAIKNGLSFLCKEEMGINYELWLNENKDIIKRSEK